MQSIFTALSHAVEGEPALAIAAAFAWGVASLLLSPCHLASIGGLLVATIATLYFVPVAYSALQTRTRRAIPEPDAELLA